jgi:CheY-like chemotaxis protein
MPAVRIAIADDHAAARHLLALLLQSLGHEVVCAAADGADLVDQCVDLGVELACVDLDMPKMDGLAAAEVLAAQAIPVILISGHPDIEHIVAENEPIVAFLTKPISLEKLQSAIESATGSRRAAPPRKVTHEPGQRPPPVGDDSTQGSINV